MLRYIFNKLIYYAENLWHLNACKAMCAGAVYVGMFFGVICPLQAMPTSVEVVDQLVATALSNYPLIKSRSLEKDSAKNGLLAAKLQFLPTLQVATQRNQVAYQGNLATSPLPSTNTALVIPVYSGGGLIASHNKAQLMLEVADYTLIETLEEIANRVIGAYTSWLNAYLKIKKIKETMMLYRGIQETVSRRVEAGLLSQMDLAFMDSRLSQLQADVSIQELQEKNSRVEISNLVGTTIQLPELIASIPSKYSLSSCEDILSQSVERNPSLKKNRLTVAVINEEALITRAQALPQVSFQAQRQIGNPYVPGAQSFNAYGLVLSASTGGVPSIASSLALKNRAQALEYESDAKRLDLISKVNQECNTYQSATYKIAEFKRSAELAELLAASIDRQFRAGKRTWAELVNIQREGQQSYMLYVDNLTSMFSVAKRLQIYSNGLEIVGVRGE